MELVKEQTYTPQHPTAAEWNEMKKRALADLGLSYDQLRDEAELGEFSSLAARKLWVIIGNSA